MKKSFLFAYLCFVVLFYGCSKSNSGTTNTTPTSSQWTVGSTTYKGNGAAYDTSNTTAAALACICLSPSGSIAISFFSHPSNGTYNLTNGTSITSNDCYIIFTGGGINYTSTGKSGDKINVSFTNGKITASFTGITVANSTTTTTASGTIVQQ